MAGVSQASATLPGVPTSGVRRKRTTTQLVSHTAYGIMRSVRVLLNGRALAFQAKDTGSIPVARSNGAHSSTVRAAGS